MTGPFATFAVGDLRVGVPVEHVHEILAAPPVTRVPLAPDGVLGLLNRRGEVVTVLDARALLGLAPAAEADGAGSVQVVVTLDGELVSLAVDGEGDVMAAPGRSHPVPETVAPALRRALAGVLELDDGGIVVVLRTEPSRP